MQGSPSSLQQPSMRTARPHVPEASCKTWISFKNAASRAGGAPVVHSLFTATCATDVDYSMNVVKGLGR